MSRSIKLIINMVILLALSVNQVAAAPNLRHTEGTKHINEADTFSPTNVNSNNVLPQTTDEPIQPQETIKISGENGGTNPTISMDGRYIAFESEGNIYLYDMAVRSSTIIDVGVTPFISATGRFIAYVHNGNVYLWDGEEINEEEAIKFVGTGAAPSVSADGRYIEFENNDQIWVRDMKAGISRVSILPDPEDENYNAFFDGYISGDGKYVAFASNGTLGCFTCPPSPDPTPEWPGVHLRDLGTNQTTNIESCTNCWDISLSLDGKYLSYVSNIDWQNNLTVVTMVNTTTNQRWTASYSVYVDRNFGVTTQGYALYSNLNILFAQTGPVSWRDWGRVSKSSSGEVGNGYDYTASVSADGKVVAFSSTSSNLVENDTNGQEDVFVRGFLKKPPLILVHGFQGFNFDGGGYHCADGIVPYDGTNSTLESEIGGLRSIADMFAEQGFEVWIAHLETNPEKTWGIVENGECLRDQIEYVASVNSSPITIAAHSYGGLVSRNAIRGVSDNVEINALYTFGSPHAGIPSEYLIKLAYTISILTTVYNIDLINNVCLEERQIGVCQMTPSVMPFFNKANQNVKGVEYTFIGGYGGTHLLNHLWKILGPGGTTPNDNLVGTYSAIGWTFPVREFSSNWVSQSMPGQFVTDETHPSVGHEHPDYLKAFYVAQAENGPEGYSDTFLCIQAIMKSETPNPNHCEIAQNYQPSPSVQAPTSQIQTSAARVDANQTVSTQVSIDNNSEALFFIQWSGTNSPIFTLTTPASGIIDPAYATLHPEEVSYEIGDGSDVSLPYIVYRVTNAPTGAWQLNITATDDVAYQSIVVIEDSIRTLEVSTDLDIYQVGDIATITAELESNNIGLAGATINVDLMRPDEVIDTVTLLDPENDGVYIGTYTIPDAPGFMPMEVHASGNDNGVAYTRQTSSIVNIAPNDLQLTGNNSDSLNDDNADGFAESLDFTFEVNADIAEEYNISAELYAGNELVTQAADYFTLNTGTQTVTLQFDGSDIREMGLNGPYTIKNLSATPLGIGIEDLYVENVHTTSAYSYTEFGRYPCYPLIVNHTGNGSDPQFTPSNSKGCFTNEFVAGEFINLTATPSAGWSVGNWDGTIADTSTSTTNIALMPANSHAITVNYINPNIPWSNTFLGGSGNDRGYEMVADGSGNFYVTGISTSSWGNPILPFSGGQDVFLAKVDASGNLVWNTFFGNATEIYDDGGREVILDDNGDVYIAGRAAGSWGNPVRPYSGTGDDGFVIKLNSSGQVLWMTFLGGDTSYDDIRAFEVKNGLVYVSGDSSATWGSPINAHSNGVQDGFMAILDAGTGSLNWNTFFGATGYDYPFRVRLDGSGNIFLAGFSTDTWGTPVVEHTGNNNDGFVAKFNPSGVLIWNTFMGTPVETDIVYDIDVSTGDIYIVGRSPLTWGDPLNAHAGGGIDAFIAKMDPTTGALLWHRFVGSSGSDFAYSLQVDVNNIIHIVGSSDASWGSPVRAHAGGYDSFYARFNSAGGLLMNSFVGGSGADRGYGFELGTNNDVYLLGYSDSTWDTPVIPYSSGNDAYLVRINITETPVIVSSVTRASANPTNANSVNYTVTFSEAVTGVDTADFTLSTTGVTGASVTGVSGTGDTYTVTVNTGSGSGTIRLDVTNNGSITGSGSRVLSGTFSTGQSYSIDKTFPTVLSSVRGPMNSNTSGLNFTVTFSESVTGVDTADFTLTTTGVIGASVLSVTGSGSSYVVNVNPGSGSGTVRLNIIDNDSIIDVVSNRLSGTGTGNGSFTTGASYTVTSVTLSSLGTQDGQILESSENSNVGGTVNATATTFVVGDDAVDKQYINLMHFDTSTLPDTAVIASAIVQVRQQGSVTGTNPFTTHGNLVAAIQKPYFGTNNSLLAGDFQATPGMAGVATFSSTPTNSWYSASMISGGFLYINLTGTTQIRIGFSLDDNDDNGADYIAFASGNNGTTANRPKIIIQYYLP